MKKQLPEKKYERTMHHNYLILQEMLTQTENQYMKRMMTENTIQGLLPMQIRYIDGQEAYYYEIHSKQSLDRMFERKSIGLKEQVAIIRSYIQLQKHLEEYLLTSENIILDPSYVFMNPADCNISFVCFPEYEQDSREGFREFMEFILEKIDHTDEAAVMLGYQLYKYTREEHYLIEGICEILEKHTNTLDGIKQQHDMDVTSANLSMKSNKSVVLEENQYHVTENQSILATEQIEDCQDVDDIESERKQEKKSRIHKILSIICLIGAVICMGILITSKAMKVITLPQEYEMIVFSFLMMLAVSCVLFRKLEKKSETHKEVFSEVEIEQKERMQDNFAKVEDYVIPMDIGIHKQEEEIHEFFPVSSCETTVLSEQRCDQGYWLLRKDENHREQYEMKQFPFVIGRMQAYVDLLLEETSISKMHARIEKKDNKLFVIDLNSTNGTYINGKMLAPNELTELNAGDEIMLGRALFCLQ